MTTKDRTAAKPLRIAVVAHALRAAGGISVGQNILAALGRVAPEHHYFVSIPSGLGYEQVCREIPNCETLIFQNGGSLFRRWRFESRDLPARLKAFRPDVVLALGNKGVSGIDCTQAIMCQNSYLYYPKKYFGRYPFPENVLNRARVLVQRRLLRRDLRHTNLLLCQTETAEKRMRVAFRYKGETLICPNAVSKFVQENATNADLPQAPAPFADQFRCLYLTRYYPHKNLEILVDLLREYRSDLADVVVFITIEPKQHPGARRLLDTIERYNLQDHICNVGPLAQEDLGAWFTNCDALLMPTLMESFSGTYLEAMLFGLPILTSDLDFAHEVCEDAALYFDPWDTASIRDAILEVRNRPNKASELVQKGKERLSSMNQTWEDIVRGVLENIQAHADEKGTSLGAR